MVLHRQVEKIRELFERIGARGDDGAGQAGVVVEDVVDALGQLNPLVERHRRAGDVGELLGLGPGVSLQARNQLQHFFGAQPGAAASGDRAAGGDES